MDDRFLTELCGMLEALDDDQRRELLESLVIGIAQRPGEIQNTLRSYLTCWKFDQLVATIPTDGGLT